MRWIFIVALLIIAITKLVGQSRLEWNANRKIAFSDFKGTNSTNNPNQRSIVGFGIENLVSDFLTKGKKNLNESISCFFLTDQSWINSNNEAALRHAQTVFDIHEWQTREIRKRYAETSAEDLKQNHTKLDSAVGYEFNLLMNLYDSESNKGENAEMQVLWELKINNALSRLFEYCQKCK